MLSVARTFVRDFLTRKQCILCPWYCLGSPLWCGVGEPHLWCCRRSLTIASRKIVGFLGSSDPQVIFETLRLVQSCLTHSGGTEMWKGSITSNKEIEENLQFILQSSTVGGSVVCACSTVGGSVVCL